MPLNTLHTQHLDYLAAAKIAKNAKRFHAGDEAYMTKVKESPLTISCLRTILSMCAWLLIVQAAIRNYGMVYGHYAL